MKSLLAFLGLGTLAALSACSTGSSDDTRSADQDWVIHPNGTADRATVTLRLPEVFKQTQGRLRWEFRSGEQVLEPGTPVLLDPTPHTVSARLFEGSDFVSSATIIEVTPRAGFDTEVTFGVVNTHLTNLKSGLSTGWVDTTALSEGADLVVGSPKTYAEMTAGPTGAFIYASSRDTSHNWRFSGFDMPFPAGHATLSVQHFRADEPSAVMTSREEIDVVVSPGKRTEVEIAADAIAPLATAGVVQLDEKTMSALNGEAYGVKCQSDRPNIAPAEKQAIAASQRTTIYTGRSEISCELTVDGLAPVPFTTRSGSEMTVALHRIEVDDVELTDVSPPARVIGEFSVAQDGKVMVLRGRSRFQTARGIVVPAGHKYTVTVFYRNAAGVEKQLSYEQDL